MNGWSTGGYPRYHWWWKTLKGYRSTCGLMTSLIIPGKCWPGKCWPDERCAKCAKAAK